LPCSEPGASAAIDFGSQFPDLAFGRDYTPFAARQGSFSGVDCRQYLGSIALTLFPEPQGLFHRILGPLQSSRLDGLSYKRFLIGCEMYFHESSV
jgi:hypothetical protein